MKGGNKRLERLNSTNYNSQGYLMTIIEYKDANHIIVEFDDSYKTRLNTKYDSFYKGNCPNPNHDKIQRLGNSIINNQGLKMTIIEYNNANNISVQFEDGFIAKQKQYKEFCSGSISNKNHKRFIKHQERLHEWNTNFQGLKMQIINYNGCEYVTVQFEDKCCKYTTYDLFTKGIVQHPYKHYLFNTWVEGIFENTKEYRVWRGVLVRCLDYDFKKDHPTYITCTICDDWLNFNNFKKWYQDSYYDINEDLEVDKDLLIYGNKHYSPETCILIPSTINQALAFSCEKQSSLPIGVSKPISYGINQYQARIQKYKESISLGYYANPDQASAIYKKEKIIYWDELIHHYNDLLPKKIINAMKKYNIGGKIDEVNECISSVDHMS